jgi:superfamily II DNA or RNA helicase
MNQWKERIRQFLPNARVGTIQGKIIDTDNKDIVLCMLQSLSQKEYDIDLFDSFGTVIVDECFPYEQNIITDKGTIPIGDLYNLWRYEETLPLIQSYNLQKERFEWKKMTYAWEKENDKLIEIHCNNTIYKSTYNHKYLTNYGWYPASDLKIGDLLKSVNDTSFIKIDNISYSHNPNKKVYDIEVEDNHNFIICGSKCENGVVVHNCHHISAEVFSRSLPKINSFYSLGLSATPNRTDGLSKVFYMYLGPMIYRLEKRVDKKIRVNVIRYIDRNEDYSKEETSVIGKACIPKMITNIVNHDARNHMIETLVYKLVHSNEAEPRKILLLSDRRDHLENFYKRCSKFASVGFYVGGMKQKDLDISEKQQVILGTYPMSSEGLDIGDLNTVIFTTPKSSIEQSIGRIIRKQHAIEPLAFDIVDDFSVFPNQYRKRQQVYKKLEYDIYELRVKVNEYTPTSNPFEMILDMPYTKLETGRKKKKNKPDSDSDESDTENVNNVSNRLMNECLIDE